jgi:hypothetical protein
MVRRLGETLTKSRHASNAPSELLDLPRGVESAPSLENSTAPTCIGAEPCSPTHDIRSSVLTRSIGGESNISERYPERPASGFRVRLLASTSKREHSEHLNIADR